MKPRKLTVLRIDDRAFAQVPATPTAATQHADAPPESVELVKFGGSGGELTAIDGWASSLRYWAGVQAGTHPDLVVCDVLFDWDMSTPLNWDATDTQVPTGLSHLKPFAAVSRTAGRPLGVGIHTANPRIWEALNGDAATQRMAALAAHEIGEVAAILGDDELVEELEHLMSTSDWPNTGSPLPAALEACWKWLERRSSSHFDGALKRAVLDYRRLLAMQTSANGEDARPRSFVLPSDWVRLMKSCEALKTQPTNLRDSDIEVPFRGWDSGSDCILLSSLFADVHDILDVVLPASCFEPSACTAAGGTASGTKPWELDASGRPQVGAYLASLGSLGRAYDQAVQALGSFVVRPIKPGDVPRHLREVVADQGSGPLARGLVVVLQWVRREFENRRLWQEAYQSNDWNRQKQEFGCGAGTTLEEWIRRLQNLVRGRRTAFYRADAFEEAQWDPAGDPSFNPDATWVRWHFDRLVDLGVLDYDAGLDEYRWQHSSSDIPPVPSPLPTGLDWVGAHAKNYLRDALGFGAPFGPMGDNPHAIGQIVRQAFWLSTEAQGRSFVDQFMEGDAPIWLAEVAREFARDTLGWKDERTWPRCLQ